MKPWEIKSSIGACRILIDESLESLKSHLEGQKTVIVTDRNVRRFHQDRISCFPVIEIGVGERIKTLQTVEKIYQAFLELELDRSSLIIGLGGGVVCDIAGFAASTYLRGLSFAFVPSTLLAQADASIGGKNGVNFRCYKNLVGTFRQPKFILLDFSLLRTLPKREFLCGVAEIIKHALIRSPSLFHFLEEEWRTLFSLEPEIVKRVVVESIKIKSEIVQRDAREKGERKKLNFGHTFGHALEKILRIPHGKAISLGMVVACKISVARGLLEVEEALRAKELLQKFKLPCSLSVGKKKLLLEAMRKDKKRQGEDVHFVLLEGIGKANVEKISYQELEEHVHDLCEYSRV